MNDWRDQAIRIYEDLLFEHHLDDTKAHLRSAIERNPLIAECRVLRPYFIDAPTYDHMLETGALLGEAMTIAANRLLHDRALRISLGIPKYFDEILELDRPHARPAVMARFDGLYDEHDELKIIEYNSQPEFSPVRAIDDTFATAPIAKAFARHFHYRTMRLDDHAIASLRVDHGADKPPSTIAVPHGSDGGRHWLRRAQTAGHRVCFAPFDKLHFDRGRLFVDDGGIVQVDLVVLQWEDLLCPTDEMTPVLDAVRAGVVRPLDGISLGLLCGYKHTFELLSDPIHANMFDARISTALARHVPWTRVVRDRKTTYRAETIDLLAFIEQNRERLVLKPSGGNQGMGVLIGPLCDEQTWREAVGRAVKQNYIVQEWVRGERGTYALLSGGTEEATSDLNPFLWNGSGTGACQIRLTTSGKHCAEDGASVTAAWVIDGRSS